MEEIYDAAPSSVPRKSIGRATRLEVGEATERRSTTVFHVPYRPGGSTWPRANYTIGDVIARFTRMQGYNVLQPMVGTHSAFRRECAMSNGVPPRSDRQNIAYMRNQMKSLGFAIDWKRELATCDPTYYRWNQWLFLRMLEKASRTGKPCVNWDPVIDRARQRAGDRGAAGARRSRREARNPDVLPQHHALRRRVVEFADNLPGWPSVSGHAGELDRRSEGCEVAFPYAPDTRARLSSMRVEIFTTRGHRVWCHVHGDCRRASDRIRGPKNNSALAAFVDECRRAA